MYETKNIEIQSYYNQFSKVLMRFILGRIKDKDIADDILHDVFIKVHDNIHTLRDVNKIESWLFQITRNRINDYFKKSKKVQTIIEEYTNEEKEENIVKKLSSCVEAMINYLPEPYKEALILVHLNKVPQKQLAEELGISYSGAKSRVQRGKVMLREIFEQCCHFEFDRHGVPQDYYNKDVCCKNFRC